MIGKLTDIALLGSLYTMLLSTIAIMYKDKIKNQVKKSIKQYLEYMDDVPIKYSVGK